MSDLALKKRTDGIFDLDFDGSDLVLSDSVQESILLSLMVNGRENVGDSVAITAPVLGGWWGNSLEDVPVGSLLWTLYRRNIDGDSLDDAKSYAEKSLQWMVDDGVAKSVSVDVSADDVNEFQMDFVVEIEKPDGTGEEIRFDYVWHSMK